MVKLIRHLLIYFLCAAPSVLCPDPYVMGHLRGQLGNQFFIIAAATSLALDNNAVPIFPDLVRSVDNNIPLNYKFVFKRLNTSRPRKPLSFVYHEPDFTYSPIPYRDNMMIVGFFQSEKYFINHREEIIELFAPPSNVLIYLDNRYRDILTHPLTVAVHYRSYRKEDPQELVYPDISADYYEKAMSLFPDETLFVVFSNDMESCKKKLSHIPKNMRYIEGELHIHDFYLMSRCHHQIICNSTFSWWAAYLNPNKDKIVIVPPKWFQPEYQHDDKDLIPPEWIILK